jgi:hypothetical protein
MMPAYIAALDFISLAAARTKDADHPTMSGQVLVGGTFTFALCPLPFDLLLSVRRTTD